MIELKLTVTTEQLRAIADVLDGDYERTPTPVVKTPEQILQETEAEMQEKKPVVAGVTLPQWPTDAPAQDGNATPSAPVDLGEDAAGAAFAASPEGCQADDTPPPPPPADVQLAKSTSTGQLIPWDERIHAASKKINAGDGTWRLKKGVDRDNLVPAVEEELAGKQSNGQTTSPPVEQPSVQNAEPSPTTSESASVNNTPPPPPPAETTAPTTIGTFPELLPLVTAAKAAGTLTDDRINEIIAEMGLTKFGELAVRTDKVAEFAAKAGLTNG